MLITRKYKMSFDDLVNGYRPLANDYSHWETDIPMKMKKHWVLFESIYNNLLFTRNYQLIGELFLDTFYN